MNLSTTKTLFFLLTFLCTTAIFHSCVKDEIFLDKPSSQVNGNIENFNPSIPKEMVVTNIFGWIVDENDYPSVGSEVTLHTFRGIKTTKTDSDGNFFFSNVMVVKEGVLLKVQNHGKFDAFRNMSLTRNSYNYTKIKLLSKRFLGTISSVEGGTLTDTESPAKLNLQANSIRQENGEEYTGEVRVRMSWIDPTAEDLAERIVGDLSGIDKNGNPMALGTFGMLNVELRGENWEYLQIKEGMFATLSFPVPDELLAQAPPKIPLWSFDEELGTWIEESSANLQDGFYVGEVGHFSSWNVDTKTNPISISGEVLIRTNEEDMAASYLQVYVNIEGVRQVGGYLDERGEFEFYNFPANTTFTLSVLDFCGGILWEEELGPYAEDTDLETIVVQGVENNFMTIAASGVDCNGNPVEDGYAKLQLNGVVSYFPLAENGSFETVVNVCESMYGSLSIVDTKNGRTSFEEALDFSNSPIEIHSLAVCNELDTFMDVHSDDFGKICIVDLKATIYDDNKLSLFGSDNEGYYTIEIIIDNIDGINVYENALLIFFDFDAGFFYSVTVEITKFEETAGSTILGNFFSDDFNSTWQDTLYGDFKAILQ